MVAVIKGCAGPDEATVIIITTCMKLSVFRFDVKKRLGKGAYGIVWKAVDKKTKDVVAIKKIFDAFRNQTDAQRTFREIIFLQSFRNHPNIVKLHSIHR